VASILAALIMADVAIAERPRIGLVLSGGGARGAAHIGVLRELERMGVPIDFITGTSIGAIVGGMYASGLSTRQIESLLNDTDWKALFRDQPPRQNRAFRRKVEERFYQIDKEIGLRKGKLALPTGIIQGNDLQLLLEREFLSAAEIQDFDNLPIPFRCVATDITTSEAVVLRSGKISTAVRASMSVPAIFSVVEIDDKLLVDGGISNNLPVDVAREMGADIIIAVDVGSHLLQREQLVSALGITAQLTSILVRRTTQEQIRTLEEDDILITPDLGSFSSADFATAISQVEKGVRATVEQRQRLATLAMDPADYARHRAERRGIIPEPPVISFVEINNSTGVSDALLASRIRQQPGQPLNVAELEKDIGELYGMGIFQSVSYVLVERDGETGLRVSTSPKPWGPNYLQLGLSLNSDFSDTSELIIRLGYLSAPLNQWNGESRFAINLGRETGILAELYQPLGADTPFFLNTGLSRRNRKINVFDDGNKVDLVDSQTTALTLTVGRELGFTGDIRLGLNRNYTDNSSEFGREDPLYVDENGGRAFLLLRADTLDDLHFPRSGLISQFEWRDSLEVLGADREYDQALLDLFGTISHQEHTFQLGARYYTTVEGVAPIQDQFRAGGLFEFPGFFDKELSSQNLYLLRSGYMKELQAFPGPSPHFGIVLNYGQFANRRDDLRLSDGTFAGSLWLGWDTPVGGIYVGYGGADTGDSSLYLKVGTIY
jgi:NTE family protein